MRSFSLTSHLAPLIVLVLLFLAIPLSSALTVSQSKLFIFVQGIDSSLTATQAAAQDGNGTDPYFFKNGHLGIYLQTQAFPNARYLESVSLG